MGIIKITFDDLEEMGYPGVTDYCRFLVKMDGDLVDKFHIHVYRGDMLCLTVNNIKLAATIEANKGGWRKYVPKAQEGVLEPRGGVLRGSPLPTQPTTPKIAVRG